MHAQRTNFTSMSEVKHSTPSVADLGYGFCLLLFGVERIHSPVGLGSERAKVLDIHLPCIGHDHPFLVLALPYCVGFRLWLGLGLGNTGLLQFGPRRPHFAFLLESPYTHHTISYPSTLSIVGRRGSRRIGRHQLDLFIS